MGLKGDSASKQQQQQQQQLDMDIAKPPPDSPMGSSDDTGDDAAAVVVPMPATGELVAGPRSIYTLWSRRRQGIILATVSLAAILVPLCDTIILPALTTIQADFQTTQELAAATVAIYMFTVGLSSLLWGPASDRFGRRTIYLASTAAFIATSLVCVFAPNIGLLVAFRALQGASVAAYAATGSGVLSDVFEPARRGVALGISTIPMLIGPILGPILGGGLAQAFGWRSTFIAITVFAGVIILPLLLLGLPETHQYRSLRRLAKRAPEDVSAVTEAQEILSSKPVFRSPLYPLSILCERPIVLHALVALLAFASMFCSITELPIALARPPYSLSPAIIGVAYLPGGVAGILFAPIGGKLSDWALSRQPGCPMMRLQYNNAAVAALLPASLVLYGWAIQFHLHLAIVLLAQFLIGGATSLLLPAIFGFLTQMKQQASAAAAAGLHCSMFVMSGVLILVAAAAAAAMGFGPFFTLLAGINLIAGAVAAVQIARHRGDAIVRVASSRVQLASEAQRAEASRHGGGGGNV